MRTSRIREVYQKREIEKFIKREEQLEKLCESLSNLTSTILSKGHLTDSDAAEYLGLMNTLRVSFQELTRENGNGVLNEVAQRLYARVSGMVDTIDFESCLLDALCEEFVEKVLYAVVVSTVALLSIVYQYLLGYVLKGGTKAHSSGTLDFRDTFVSLLLFRGSYVWIFFRDVAPRKVYRRSKKDEAGRVTYHGKYEPRFKPPREKQPGGTSIKFDHLPLGGYDSERDAEIACQIAGFYYLRDEGRIELRDGTYFTIPAVPEQEQSLSGKARAQWVAAKAKEVFGDFQLMNNAMNLPSQTNTVAVRDFFEHAVSEEITLDALWDAADAHPVTGSLCADGEGLEGTVTPPSSADLNLVDNFITVGEVTPASPSVAEQAVLSTEQLNPNIESNDVDSISELDIITQQLKERLEAEIISRRVADELKKFEERISRLERNAKPQLEDECM